MKMKEADFDHTGILAECERLRRSIQPLNDRSFGPLEKCTQRNTILPFVFLLGNHSSGKSSFINYILNRKIQTTGVAPTDDSFTIIMPGPNDLDRDGPALINDPDLGFSGLQQFGPALINHTQLKIRSNLAMNNFMILDSPGMIDSPKFRDFSGNNTQSDSMDRGYNFEQVVKWYAERADVILLFFDPDKPGTTGETLSILTHSLIGMEHKLHIILNKSDQFRKIHDFARAYGSLCWNLSKVIPRKDLPRIYTMSLPYAAYCDIDPKTVTMASYNTPQILTVTKYKDNVKSPNVDTRPTSRSFDAPASPINCNYNFNNNTNYFQPSCLGQADLDST
eukprot:gene13702-29131_t